MSQPNILFIISDQHRADHVGFMGNQVVRTPHLDSIAERGTVFENAWVANPVCMPNRSTLMTGRLPTAHGVIFNDRSLEWGTNTWVRTLRGAGYRTGLIGKSHLQHGMSRNSVRELAQAPAVLDPYPEHWDHLEHFENYLDDVPEAPEDFYGFDTVELTIDHGARVTGHHLQWALAKGANREHLLVPYTAESPSRRRSEHWWQVYEPPYDPEFHSTSFVTERTIAFVEQAQSEQRPWVAWASFPDPHHPMTPPGQWFDRHSPTDMELPTSFEDPLDSAPDYLRKAQQLAPSNQRGWVQPCGATSADLLRECISATYGMIEMIDDGVGRILAAVEAAGATEDTIVVFTADHGDMMGDHGLLLKGFMPYSGTMRVPLVVADPRRRPNRSRSLVGSVDVASTMLDLVGLDEFHGMQGTSLAPVLDNPKHTVHCEILIEDDLPDGVAERSPIPRKTRTVVTSDGMKYTRNSDGDDLLFDLVADPEELNDLSVTDRARRTDAIERLADALITTADQARGAPVTA